MGKRNALQVFAVSLSLIALAACSGKDVQPTQQGQPTPTPSIVASNANVDDPQNYPDIEALFLPLHDSAAVSFAAKGTRLEATILCAGLAAETAPDNWDAIASSFAAALVDGKATAEQYGFDELSGQLEANDGPILISGFGGKTRYDLFSQAASESGSTSITLGPGTYTVGQDITAGTYDCVAVSGFGVLRGEVAAFGTPGFVQTMGNVSASVGGESASITGASSYSNLPLADGDILYIEMNLNVEFVPK